MARRFLVLTAFVALSTTILADPGARPSIPPFPRTTVNADAMPAWSPDDREIAYMTLPPGALLIVSSTGGTPRRVFQDDHQYATPAWSPDGKRLAFTSNRGGAWAVWVSMPDGSDARAIAATPFSSVYAPAWSPDGARVLYSAIASSTPKLMLTDVGPTTMPPSRVVDGWRPRWSPDGRRIAYTDRFTESGKEFEAIAVAAADGSSPRRLRSVVAPFSNPHLATDWSPDGKRLVAARRNATRTELLSVDPETDTATVIAPVEGYAYDPAWSHDGARIAYSSVTSDRAGEIHVVPVTGGAPVALTSRPQGVAARLVGFASDDSLRVPAWLYVPRSKGRHPAIVWVHGGWPGEGNLGDGYDRAIQYFVGQGYVVLAPNFRGSTGFGEQLEHVTDPAQVVADLLASGRYLRTLPSADPRRIGILGMSGGGFWTTLTVGREPTAFAAAVDFFGPTDLVEFQRTVPVARAMLEHLLGPYAGHETAYREASPITHVSRITAPVLVLHGTTDRTIPFDQSVRFVDAMRAAGKNVRFERFAGGHGFEGEDNARAFETVAAFLAEHLTPR